MVNPYDTPREGVCTLFKGDSETKGDTRQVRNNSVNIFF